MASSCSTVAMIDIAVLLMAANREGGLLAPSSAFDDLYKLVRMMLDAADIRDRYIGLDCDIIRGAAEPVLDLPVAAPRPRSQALAKNFRWRRDRHHRDIGIGAAYRVNHRA